MDKQKERSKILVVDDNKGVRKLLRLMLSGDSYTIIEAEDGKIALEKAEEQNPDIILLDGNMPVMDGFESCRVLKQNPKTKTIPIIFCTADMERIKEKNIEFDDCIEKPFSIDELRDKINRLLYK